MEDAFLAALGENRDTERLVIHLDGIGRIDTTAALALRSARTAQPSQTPAHVRTSCEHKTCPASARAHETLIAVGLIPRADVGERAQPVDAGVRPEVDENDLAAQVLHSERRRVEPAGRAVETGQVSLGPQLGEQAHLAVPLAPTVGRSTAAAATGVISVVSVSMALVLVISCLMSAGVKVPGPGFGQLRVLVQCR